jgi:hypothetical protein
VTAQDHVRESLASIYRTRCELDVAAAQRRYDEAIRALEAARSKGPGRHVEKAWKAHTKATANLNAAQRALRAVAR